MKISFLIEKSVRHMNIFVKRSLIDNGIWSNMSARSYGILNEIYESEVLHKRFVFIFKRRIYWLFSLRVYLFIHHIKIWKKFWRMFLPDMELAHLSNLIRRTHLPLTYTCLTNHLKMNSFNLLWRVKGIIPLLVRKYSRMSESSNV